MKIFKFIIVIAILLFTNKIHAQNFLRDIKSSSDNQISLADMQHSFNEWKQGKDLTKVKGWKWYKRWEDEQSSRLNPDGTFPDQSILFEEAIRVSEEKRLSQPGSGWAPVGPTMLEEVRNGYSSPGIGRINCVTFHPTKPNIMWAGVAQGGVWKTTNSGQTWTPLIDDLPITRVSDIAIDPLHPDTMYICLGDYAYLGIGIELDNRHRNIHYGLGVYKTTDGGLNWAPTGLNFNLTDKDGSLMRRVFVNPLSNQQLIAAGISGIWRSNDGGTTWQNKLDTMIWDIEQDPVNSSILYASSAYIKNLNKGSSGIYKSLDFGNTWTELITGMPKQNAIQRIELAISPTDPNYVYAIACNLDRGFYGFYKSINAGLIWTSPFNYAKDTVNILDYGDGRDGSTSGQATYDLSIMVDPVNKEKVFIAGINIWGSIDGGSTWNPSSYWVNSYGPSIHADQHFLKYNPSDKKTYICNDGGLFRTDTLFINKWSDAEFKTKWEAVSNEMAITSFYRLGLSANNEGYIIGGAQDNSTYYKNDFEWANIFGGDGMECMIDPVNPNIIYGSSQYGNLTRSDDGGFQQNYIRPPSGDDGEWTTPMVMDPSNSSTIYAGYGDLWKSTERGDGWSNISSFSVMPDAGFASPSTSIAVSSTNNDVIYLAKRLYPLYNQKSELYRTTTGGGTWNNITAGLPDSLYFKYVTVDTEDDKKAWLCVGGFIPGVKAFKTIDGGSNWINISNGLPNVSVNCIIEDKTTKYNTLYAATDLGVYYTNDTLGMWKLYSQNLPNVICSELEIHYKSKKLYVATFGRGMWMTDLIKDSVVGISENSLEGTMLTAFPNPSNGSFELGIKGLKASEIDMEIINVMGARVYSEKISLDGKDIDKTYQNILSSGLYFVRINAGTDSRTLKLIIN